MKPFKASEFISNEETPVVDRGGKPATIVTVNGRGVFKVIGYTSHDDNIRTWLEDGSYTASAKSEYDLFFAQKVEAVHVFKCKSTRGLAVAHEKQDIEFWIKQTDHTYLGTITGPIVPPENSEVAK